MSHVLVLRAVHRLLSLARRNAGTKAVATLINICCFIMRTEPAHGCERIITSHLLCSVPHSRRSKSQVVWLRSTMWGQSEEIWKQQLGRIIWIQWWVYSLLGVIIRLAENPANRFAGLTKMEFICNMCFLPKKNSFVNVDWSAFEEHVAACSLVELQLWHMLHCLLAKRESESKYMKMYLEEVERALHTR